MDSLRSKKRKIRFRMIFVTSHEIMLIYETMNGATKCDEMRLKPISIVQDLCKLYISEVFGNSQDILEDFDAIF